MEGTGGPGRNRTAVDGFAIRADKAIANIRDVAAALRNRKARMELVRGRNGNGAALNDTAGTPQHHRERHRGVCHRPIEGFDDEGFELGSVPGTRCGLDRPCPTHEPEEFARWRGDEQTRRVLAFASVLVLNLVGWAAILWAVFGLIAQ